MNASSLFAATMLAVLATFGATANADHRLWRELDELNAHTQSHARDARWEVHDHFAASRDYAELRDDSWALIKALRNVEDAIYRERSPQAILDLVEHAHDMLAHFEEHVDHSDFSRVSYRGRVRIRPTSYTHVVELQSILQSMHDDLDRMIATLEREVGHHHEHRRDGIELIPDQPFRIQPGVPSPGPARPGVLVPDLSAGTEFLVPVIRTRGVTIQY